MRNVAGNSDLNAGNVLSLYVNFSAAVIVTFFPNLTATTEIYTLSLHDALPISVVALVLSVPGGTREILAENVLAAWLDLEVAAGNDAIASHSAIRKTAKLMGQFLPGTDFVTSGYSSMPRYDNMFGGGNYDSDDLDE